MEAFIQTPMQAPLAIFGFVLGVIAWWQTHDWLWLAGAVVLVMNWPYTLLGIMPTNNALMALEPANAGPQSRKLIEKWATLHAVRTALGAAAAALFAAALGGRLRREIATRQSRQIDHRRSGTSAPSPR